MSTRRIALHRLFHITGCDRISAARRGEDGRIVFFSERRRTLFFTSGPPR